MAGVREKQLKNGVSYELIANVKDDLTGKYRKYYDRWHPPTVAKTDREKAQQRKEADRRAQEFEKQKREEFDHLNFTGELTPNSTFKEVADRWLEDLKRKGCSPTHLVASKDHVEFCKEWWGVKFCKFNSNIIQNFFDKIDGREKITRVVRSKREVLREVLKKRGESYKTLNEIHGIDRNTLCSVLNGRTKIAYETAQRVAKILDVKVDQVFEIKETRQPYAKATNHAIKSAVRTIFSFAAKKRIIKYNYAKADYITFDKKKKQQKLMCMDEFQVGRALTAALESEDIRHGTALMMLMFTGFRRGEACEIKWNNINLDDRVIEVVDNAVVVKGMGVVVKEPKTDRSSRTVGIPEVLCKRLLEYKMWYLEQQQLMGERWNDNKGHLFINLDTGKRINPYTLIKWINKVLENANLGHWTNHSMRHTNITIKLYNGVPLHEVSSDAGHSRASTTTDIYGHYLPSRESAGAAMWDKKFRNTENV